MVMRNWLFNHIDFSTFPNYEGNDLGVFWYPEKTTFKIWAPTAVEVELRLYESGKDGKPFLRTNLKSLKFGCWAIELEGDFEGKFYTFKIKDSEGWLNEVPDIYSTCVGVNGKRGMIFDRQKTNPEVWENDKGPRYNSFTETIIYEIHVRDFSISEFSGIINKGKYVGFAEENTQTPEGLFTGVAYLKELGITHIHLLPVYDFYTVDEEHPNEKYNWGYDPQNFNALEGSYSTNPFDGKVRIREFKELVKALHKNGIGVIMDVVYNHTGLTKRSVFNQTVPGYFYRQKPDGTFSNASGCGNEIASERAMVRKYIIDSLKYWATEFHIDGFRFDLMGIYDLPTMQAIRAEMDKMDKGIFLYGEGWAADLSPMPENFRAVKNNIKKLPGIAAFSDDMRDALKGGWGGKKTNGFVSGLALNEEAVKFGIVGATYHPQIVYDYIKTSGSAWAAEPTQCINYVSCHDNYTLWDKIKLSNPNASDEELKKMVKLAGAIVLTSQGVPFIHAGMEFCRTKNGVENSYKSSDLVNQIDWNRKAEFGDVVNYFQKLIQLRKNHPAFRMEQSEQIRQNLNFCKEYQLGVVAYCLNGKAVNDRWNKIVVIFNGNNTEISVPLDGKKYQIMSEGSEINEQGLRVAESESIIVLPVSMTILIEV